MTTLRKDIVGVDLFSGAGGLSLGARMAGVDVQLAIESDKNAAATYVKNHPNTKMILDDISKVQTIDVSKKNKTSILFGGPPCQGFSTSNQRTRKITNPSNWLFKEFIRIASIWNPDWIVFENVKGIVETENGIFINSIIKDFEGIGYTCSMGILCASDFGVPQKRSRLFIIASRYGIKLSLPKPKTTKLVTVSQAIADLPSLMNGSSIEYLPYKCKPKSPYARKMRGDRKGCSGHLVTNNALKIIKRYENIPQGGNWESVPKKLLDNYKDPTRCHSGIYRRLYADQPSVVLGNFRKNMLIHPWENRGLSIREAARLQSFPDWYEFKGSIGFQQQQVGNAVPPLLAKAVFYRILLEKDRKKDG